MKRNKAFAFLCVFFLSSFKTVFFSQVYFFALKFQNWFFFLLSSFGLGAPKNVSAPGATLSRYATAFSIALKQLLVYFLFYSGSLDFFSIKNLLYKNIYKYI